ncbi:methyltransferase domain-containing protein [Maribellus comscasis]|uniref:Methyltransferase domain-containing protein n=1 Tax=Maribellus comscasis TaxID=2681766 RepID=A0A6I6JYL6_9BACT|nr:methyltransferase domain-containing protein [Maribellus comscasis]QGY45337.1 methyltransferase domain-containing protein [Maribellus comscasis]
MMISVLKNDLLCIYCKSHDLKIMEQSNVLVCENCKQKYNIRNDVPVLLRQDKEEDLSKSDIHQKQETNFNYIDHYQKDGVEFNYFEERDRGTEHMNKRVGEYILSQIKNKSGKILDVGCGKAWVAKELCPRGCEVVSMDISLENTSEALKRYPFENHAAVVADVFSLPFKENVFDYIVASEIIEHVADPAKFVENLIRVLKPGGSLIVTTPYKEKIRYSLCVHCNNPTPLHAHIHSFDERILKDLYKAADLESYESFTFGNKIPVHLRMHGFLKFFNFWCWKKMDQVLNLIYNAPLRILAKWEKKVK